MANKTRIEFEGFDEVIAKLTQLDSDVKNVTEKTLRETHKLITKKAETAIAPHKETGVTEKSLKKNAEIKWAAGEASVETGFSIRQGGLASIFLIYGTPRMKKDQNLYNAFFGNKTKKEVTEIQEDIFFDEIRRLDI